MISHSQSSRGHPLQCQERGSPQRPSSLATSLNLLLIALILSIPLITCSVNAQQNTFSGSLSRSYILQLADDASLEVLRAYSVGYTANKGGSTTAASSVVGETKQDAGMGGRPPSVKSDPSNTQSETVHWVTTPKAPWAKPYEAWKPEFGDEIDKRSLQDLELSDAERMERREREILEERQRKWKGLGFQFHSGRNEDESTSTSSSSQDPFTSSTSASKGLLSRSRLADKHKSSLDG